MKDRPDRHHDRTLRTVEPTQLKSHNLVIFTNLELHHVALEAVEKLAKFACLWDDVNIEAGIGQPSFHELRGSLDRSIGIREKVDVLGGPGDDAMRYQCMAARESESMFAGRVESQPSHVGLKRVGCRRHAAARARNDGCCSSQARRTPRGTNRSPHSRTSVGPSNHLRNSSTVVASRS